MKKTLFALLIALACSTSMAATQSIQASGTVATSCSFTGNVDGTLAVNPASPSVITTSSAAGGTPASVTVAYLGTPTITVDTPTSFTTAPSAVTALNPSFSISATSASLGLLVDSGSGATGTYTTGSSDSIIVNMSGAMASGASTPTGSYVLGTTVTCQ